MALRFTDKELLAWHYRQSFLAHTEREAPEVLETLKTLIPKYRLLINDFPDNERLIDWLNGEVDLSDDPAILELQRSNILDDLAVIDRRYNATDPAMLPEAEETAWTNFLDLRDSFAAFINQYGLTTDWLRIGLFRLLGDLARSERHFNSLCYVYSHGYSPAEGEAIQLELEGWQMAESWEEFEARARQRFDATLSNHKTNTAKAWRESGYKKTTKPLDLTSVKWLVLWTVKGTSKAEILERIDNENEESGKTYDIKTLEHHFRRLESEYDLPVRSG